MTILVDKNEWRKIFVNDIKKKLKESKNEFDKYKSSGRVVFLQQAGNKLFSVIENWLMVKYNVRVQSYRDLRKVVKNNRVDRLLLSKVAQLHYFFYENELRGESSEFEDIYMEIYDIMKNRVKKLYR